MNTSLYSRRKFIRQTGILGVAGAFVAKSSWATALAKTNLPAPGLQLFTLMSEIDNDTVGTLQKVASYGYKNIETAFSKQSGIYGRKPKEFKSLLSDMGMQWRSHHVIGGAIKLPPGYKMPTGADGKPMMMPAMKNLTDNSQELIDTVAEGGIPYIVCANIPVNTGDSIKQAAEVLQKAGEQAKKAGLQLVYHNHANEFTSIDGIVAYDYFLSQINADILKMELDLGWAFKAGKNPVDIFNQHPGRFPLWHVKDMTADGAIVAFGEGTYDFTSTFKNASKSGLQYFFIEQDFPKKPFESIQSSIQKFENFKNTL